MTVCLNHINVIIELTILNMRHESRAYLPVADLFIVWLLTCFCLADWAAHTFSEKMSWRSTKTSPATTTTMTMTTIKAEYVRASSTHKIHAKCTRMKDAYFQSKSPIALCNVYWSTKIFAHESHLVARNGVRGKITKEREREIEWNAERRWGCAVHNSSVVRVAHYNRLHLVYAPVCQLAI